jgi:hypothetical protein
LAGVLAVAPRDCLSALTLVHTLMRGGRRANAGRKPGPEKVRLVAYILPESWRTLCKLATHAKSLGAILDGLLLRKTTDKIVEEIC